MAQHRADQMRIGRQGRAVIPVAIRREMKLRTGDTVVVRMEEGRLVLEPRAAVLERVRRRFDGIPKGVSLARELLAERRTEARREAKRDAGTGMRG